MPSEYNNVHDILNLNLECVVDGFILFFVYASFFFLESIIPARLFALMDGFVGIQSSFEGDILGHSSQAESSSF